MLKYLVLGALFCIIITNVIATDLQILIIDRDLGIALEGVKIIDVDTGAEAITDMNGDATLSLDNNVKRLVIVSQLIGYETRKQLVTDFSSKLIIELLMKGIMEGQELVVEVEAIGETDAEVGVSTVIDKEIIQAAAKMGIIEDVMNAVKILPGVTYSGGFGSPMSVRGGNPDGLTVAMDGFVCKNPTHFNGLFSIFNPNIVESIKFSPGIFSVKNGQATSALLEINTVNPDDGLKLNGIISTSTIEAFIQTPLGKKDEFGLFAGFRLTNYELSLAATNLFADLTDIEAIKSTTDNIEKAPYIYDFYFKGLYSPSETFKWHINGFWGNDGIGYQFHTGGDKETQKVFESLMYLKNSDFFVSTGLKSLIRENLLLNTVIGYEYWVTNNTATLTEEGYEEYSQIFKDRFSSQYLALLGSEIPDGYSILLDTNGQQDIVQQGIQGRFDLDWSINDKFILQNGFGSNLDIINDKEDYSYWTTIYNYTDPQNPIPELKKMRYESSGNNNKTIMSFFYSNFNANFIPGLLKMDLGLRVDHSYFMGEDDYTSNTYPEISPRVNLTLTPKSNNSIFTRNTFSLGSGLFNKSPFASDSFDQDLGIDNFEMKSEKYFTNVIGWETYLPGDIRFKIEGYYKYSYDRFYYNNKIIEENGVANIEPILHFDGYGHIAGGDILINKKSSRFVDGLLSYTFVYARYNDPEDDNIQDDTTVRGRYYYPSYHRFNSLNLLLNVKPQKYFTFTTKLSFATGLPDQVEGETTMFSAIITDENGNIQLAERYSTKTYYSDTFRTNIALPLDLKFSWHSYLPNSKYQWECYFALQNALSPLLNSLAPDDQKNTESFNFPIPTIGFSLSY